MAALYSALANYKTEEPEMPDPSKMMHIIGEGDDLYQVYGNDPFELANRLTIARGGVFDGKIIGQIFDTYLIVEKNGAVYIIDQHAAHERILYDKLAKRLEPKYVQALLIPYKVKLFGQEAEYFEKMMPLLNNIGFEIEKKLDNNYLFYSIPDPIVDMDFKKFMSELFKNMLSDLFVIHDDFADFIGHKIPDRPVNEIGFRIKQTGRLIFFESLVYLLPVIQKQVKVTFKKC